LLKTSNLPAKFNLKLESTYNKPNIELSSENRAFKTSARTIFADSNFGNIVDEEFAIILSEEDAYMSRGSGFTLKSIDELLLCVYRYTPMSGVSNRTLSVDCGNEEGNSDFKQDQHLTIRSSNVISLDNNIEHVYNSQKDNQQYSTRSSSSHIPLPFDLYNKKAIINPQNNDDQSFKWAILCIHVTGDNKHRVKDNYFNHVDKYNFINI